MRVVSVIANRDRGYAVAFGNGLVVLFNLDGEFVKVCKRPRITRDSTHTVRDTFRHVRDTTIVRPPRDTMRGPGRRYHRSTWTKRTKKVREMVDKNYDLPNLRGNSTSRVPFFYD
ncbi:MAG: hypothetical protein R2769_13290 [Saprospiraceae bacterium]